MQELEKILEEIENERTDIDDYSDAKGRMLARHWNDCIDVVEDIIRKHMNDGWISVEERLPDDNEDVLVTTDMGLIAPGYVTHGKWITDQEPDYPIAWRPYPEPYHPEYETKKPDWREDMLRKFNRRE